MLKELLRKHEACDEGFAWASQYASPAEAWDACERPDWMLWALEEIGYSQDCKLRLWQCWCARYTPLADGRTVWDLLTDPRSREAVEVSERFAVGMATVEELSAARLAARAAADSAWDLAARYSARSAAESAAASSAAWYSARSAAESAAESAASAAESAASATESAASATESAAESAASSAAWSAAKAQAQALRSIIGNPFKDYHEQDTEETAGSQNPA